jgi:PIN domain nuclease of toxin-antitoxin system
VKVLLDTHTFIWLFDSPEHLSGRAAAICQVPANVLVLSVVSIWEIVIKLQIGELRLGQPLGAIIDDQRQVNGLEVAPVELAHVLAVERLPLHHRDPFDRLLIAQASVESLPILSVDPVLRQYPITVIW